MRHVIVAVISGAPGHLLRAPQLYSLAHLPKAETFIDGQRDLCVWK